jgi:hypothetical protein
MHKLRLHMIKALQLIFTPFPVWERIALSQRGLLWALCAHLLPLAAVTLAIEGFLLARWGMASGEFRMHRPVPVDLAVRYAASYFTVLIAGVFFSALILKWASESFNVVASYSQCFIVMAYGFSPIFLARILDGIPQLNTWVCWAIGAAGAVSVLYHGIGMMLRPEQTKGFGLYLMTIIIVILVSALSHFAAVSVLQGKALRPRDAQTSASSALAQSSTPRAEVFHRFLDHPSAAPQNFNRPGLSYTCQFTDDADGALLQFAVGRV